jgi:hypothetical protein
MVRFKKYIGKDCIFENMKSSDRLHAFGLVCKELPDTLGDFEEIELCTDFAGQEIIMGVAILEGKLKRIMFVLPDKENPDVFRPLTETQLKDFLDQRGVQLINFFEYITQ